MRVPLVSRCKECGREYRASADMEKEAKAGDPWHWTRCSCGTLNLGVVHGEWTRDRSWLRSRRELYVDATRDDVVTFDGEVVEG